MQIAVHFGLDFPHSSKRFCQIFINGILCVQVFRPERLSDAAVDDVGSVSGFGEIPPLWQKFKSGNFLMIYLVFGNYV